MQFYSICSTSCLIKFATRPLLFAGKFLKMASQSRTFKFGKILIHEGVVFFKSKLSYAFVNIKPVVPGRILV